MPHPQVMQIVTSHALLLQARDGTFQRLYVSMLQILRFQNCFAILIVARLQAFRGAELSLGALDRSVLETSTISALHIQPPTSWQMPRLKETAEACISVLQVNHKLGLKSHSILAGKAYIWIAIKLQPESNMHIAFTETILGTQAPASVLSASAHVAPTITLVVSSREIPTPFATCMHESGQVGFTLYNYTALLLICKPDMASFRPLFRRSCSHVPHLKQTWLCGALCFCLEQT